MKFALLRMPMGHMSMLPFGQNGVADSLCAPNDTVCIEVSRGKASLRGWLAQAGASSAVGGVGGVALSLGAGGAGWVSACEGSLLTIFVFSRRAAAAARVQLHGVVQLQDGKAPRPSSPRICGLRHDGLRYRAAVCGMHRLLELFKHTLT